MKIVGLLLLINHILVLVKNNVWISQFTVLFLTFNLQQTIVNSCEFSSFNMWITNNSFATKALPFIHPSMVNMDKHILKLQISMDSGDTLFHHSSKYGNAIHIPIWLQIVQGDQDHFLCKEMLISPSILKLHKIPCIWEGLTTIHFI